MLRPSDGWLHRSGTESTYILWCWIAYTLTHYRFVSCTGYFDTWCLNALECILVVIPTEKCKMHRVTELWDFVRSDACTEHRCSSVERMYVAMLRTAFSASRTWWPCPATGMSIDRRIDIWYSVTILTLSLMGSSELAIAVCGQKRIPILRRKSISSMDSQ